LAFFNLKIGPTLKLLMAKVGLFYFSGPGNPDAIAHKDELLPDIRSYPIRNWKIFDEKEQAVTHGPDVATSAFAS